MQLQFTVHPLIVAFSYPRLRSRLPSCKWARYRSTVTPDIGIAVTMKKREQSTTIELSTWHIVSILIITLIPHSQIILWIAKRQQWPTLPNYNKCGRCHTHKSEAVEAIK